MYRITILPVVLYACEVWSHTLREEHRLRVFENRVLRRIFGSKKDKVTGEWRKLYNEELNDCTPRLIFFRMIKSRKMRWAWHIAHMRRGELYTGFWWGNLGGKRPLGRHRHRWEDIMLDIQEMKCGVMDWIELVHFRGRWWAPVNVVINLRIP
jgi:hypothetical protein